MENGLLAIATREPTEAIVRRLKEEGAGVRDTLSGASFARPPLVTLGGLDVMGSVGHRSSSTVHRPPFIVSRANGNR
jgi:hypothetical protein